jgi:NAD(P)-dependent dehydrogenase (short-subunit alcohol dehydrogenase family)
VYLVTGGRRGIGRGIALGFAEAGADVAVCDNVVDDGELAAVAEEIKRLGGHSLAAQTDVTKKSQVDSLVNRVLDEFGVIDILVNNAGIITGGTLLETSEDDWDSVINVNLKGCYLCCVAVARGMVERRSGNIVNVASAGGIRLREGSGGNVYNISKAGVIMLTKVLAHNLGEYNIRVNAIAPSIVADSGMAQAAGLDSLNPEIAAKLVATTPLGRIATVDEIVGSALFLASDASSYVTGHTIVLDGGRLA